MMMMREKRRGEDRRKDGDWRKQERTEDKERNYDSERMRELGEKQRVDIDKRKESIDRYQLEMAIKIYTLHNLCLYLRIKSSLEYILNLGPGTLDLPDSCMSAGLSLPCSWQQSRSRELNTLDCSQRL